MTYEEAKARIFAEGTAPSGYFDRTHVGLSFDSTSGRTIIVTNDDYYNAGIPLATNQEESLWLLQHHPSAHHITITSVKV